MPIVDAKADGRRSGLYGWLERAEQVDYQRWREGQLKRIAQGYAPGSYPRQRRLDAFAAGAPVNVEPGEFLGWNATRAVAPAVARPADRIPQRAIVSPDGTIEYADEGWARLFCEEHDL